jgi:hypothetical protein
MTARSDVIRLVGGPPKLDGAVWDLRLSPDDRADATDDRFVRAVRGTTIAALTSLQSRCTDRRTTTDMASAWCAVMYQRSNRPRARRAPIYRFAGRYSLEPRRDHRGRWMLALGGQVFGQPPAIAQPSATLWIEREALVDDAVGRFRAVAALIPEGPLATRVVDVHAAVESCARDAIRLCRVGALVATDSAPNAHEGVLLARVERLVGDIDDATSLLVKLHLDVDGAVDPVVPAAALASGWAEVTAQDV